MELRPRDPSLTAKAVAGEAGADAADSERGAAPGAVGSLDAPTVGASPHGRLPWRTAMGAAVVVTLVRPVTWVVALAGFLAGGGVVVLAWPILVLPTPTGLQNLLGAPVSTLVFGSPSRDLVALLVSTTAAAVLLLAAGLVAGAWAERRGIALVLEGAAEEGYGTTPPDLRGAPGVWRVAVLRLLALLPPLVVGALAWPTLYDVTYHELILPEDLATPLPLRVISRLPLLVAAVVVAWLTADAAAAVGVRRLVLERRRLFAAWALGWADLVRRPHRLIPTAIVGIAAVVLAAGPALVASGIGWARVREVLEVEPNPLVGALAAAIWVAVWLGALVLAGFGAALRAAAWTMEGAPRE